MGAYSITWDAFEMISGAQYPSRWRVAYLISVVQKSCVRVQCRFFSISWDLTRLRSQLKTQISKNEKLRTTLGFCRFRGKFLECVTLLFVVEIVSNKSPKTKPNRSTIHRTVARIGARYKVFHGSAHFVANSWPRFLLSVIIGRSPQRPRHQRVSCYIYILIGLISWYRTTTSLVLLLQAERWETDQLVGVESVRRGWRMVENSGDTQLLQQRIGSGRRRDGRWWRRMRRLPSAGRRPARISKSTRWV